MRRLLRWLFDWRSLALLLASALVALVVVVVIEGANTSQAALAGQKATAVAAARRIDLLNTQIGKLATLIFEDGKQIGALTGEITALQEQVRQLGGKPVVVTPTPAAQPTPTPPTTTTTTTTTTAPPNRSCALGVCVTR